MKGLGFLAFVALTILCWGVYGPVLHYGQKVLGDGQQLSLLKSIVGVGFAYFLIAVVFPVFMLISKGEQGGWTFAGTVWSFAAGAVGALGAIGIALSFKFGGDVVYVMPLVFGFAPVVNTVVTMLMARTIGEASPLFYAGVIIVAVGAAGVLVFKPTAVSAHSSAEPDAGSLARMTLVSHDISGQDQDAVETQDITANETENQKTSPGAATVGETASTVAPKTKPAPAKRSIPMIICCVVLTALCWGSYGPVLHKGQMKMAGSRLRPFLCVGVAYFALAVVVPVMLLGPFPEPGAWVSWGFFWSSMAGAAGALGALGIIYAFNFGGRPIFVMPLVFGGAPVINTFSQTLSAGQGLKVPSAFYLSLFLVILGAILVLTCAPKGHGKPAVQIQPEPSV